MSLASDNVTGPHAAIAEALARAAAGDAMPYGDDPWTERLSERLCDLFETSVEVFPVATGTAANALALGQLVPPHGAVFCHQDAHINTDECGAPEMATGGAKLVALSGTGGRLTPDALDTAIRRTGFRAVHRVRPAAVSLTQATECGTLYAPCEIAAIAAVCRRHGLALHMDGARFANAVAAQGLAPADLTWRCGVDVLCLGATKDGAWAAEAVVFLRPGLAADFAERRKRAGHLVSKMRFISAQLLAWLDDGLWLDNARHANDMARRLADGLAAVPGVSLPWPTQANMVFPVLPAPLRRALETAGHPLPDWPGDHPGMVRLVTSFQTRAEEIDTLLADARAAPSDRSLP